VRTAVYPGTFDPPTYGHYDIIHRARRLSERLIVAVSESVRKGTTYSLEDRTRMVRLCLEGKDGVDVIPFDGLLVDLCRKHRANAVIRGLRAVSDFEYELMMALMNRKLDPHYEAIFLMPSEEYIYLSSALVREIHGLGGDVSHLVPPPVLDYMKRLDGRRRGGG
jgi:pantetheine-phosphate adenylyltransferase